MVGLVDRAAATGTRGGSACDTGIPAIAARTTSSAIQRAMERGSYRSLSRLTPSTLRRKAAGAIVCHKIVERTSQLLKGVLDMCLLAVIAEEPSYGYEMARKLEDRGLALVGEGSIYPLLARLQKGGLVDTFVEESKGGPPRKYYRIADKGRKALDEWIGEWQSLTNGVSAVLNGGTR